MGFSRNHEVSPSHGVRVYQNEGLIQGKPLAVNMKKSFSTGCSKMPRCKALEILRSEAPADPCRDRNDEG